MGSRKRETNIEAVNGSLFQARPPRPIPPLPNPPVYYSSHKFVLQCLFFLIFESERPIPNAAQAQLSDLLCSYCELRAEAPCPFISNTSLKQILFPARKKLWVQLLQQFLEQQSPSEMPPNLPDLLLPHGQSPSPHMLLRVGLPHGFHRCR